MTAALSVRGLTHAYAGIPVLRAVEFDVQPGQVVAVVGPSGAGKTTLFRCLTRLVRADAGVLEVFGTDLQALEGSALRDARRDLGLVFQSYNLVRRLSALQNVLVGRLADVHFPPTTVVKVSPCTTTRGRQPSDDSSASIDRRSRTT